MVTKKSVTGHVKNNHTLNKEQIEMAKSAKVWHYVVHVDHHMLYQGVRAPPTVCGAEAYKILKSCGQDTTCGGATYAVVGRFLVVTLPASAGPPFYLCHDRPEHCVRAHAE